MTVPIAFVDCETTHLDASIGHAWEVAVILREFEDDQHTDTEYAWQIRPNLAGADPEALRIGRYEQRFAVPDGAEAAWTADESGHVAPMTRAEAITAIVNVLRGAVLVGSNPAFDDRHLRRLVGRGRAQWHYRPYDIVQLAAAKLGVQALGPLPWPTHPMSLAIGVEPPSREAAHTALGDARWARDVHDAAMVKQQLPLSWEGRAQHAIGLYTQTAIELEDARRDLAASTAAVQRAHDLASKWSSELLHGNAWIELRTALVDPSQPVMTDLTGVCTCTLGEPCGCDSMEPDDDQDDEEFEETGDADGDVFELISEIAGRLRDATDGGEYHAVGLIADLANGRKTIAEARAELAEITFRHV